MIPIEMDALAIRSFVDRGGIQVLYVDLGEPGGIDPPDPAVAMRTWGAAGVAIVPANATCKCDGPKPEEKFGLIIEARALALIAERAGVQVPPIDGRYKAGIGDPVLRRLMDSLEAELTHGGLATSMYIDALLAQLIVCVFRAFATPEVEPVFVTVPAPRPPDARLERAIRYIEEHLGMAIAVEEIARAADLSPYHFSRAFKRWTGQAPHQYVLRRRLERAERLVVESVLPFAQIARSVGFYDQSHLGLHFKRHFGATPREIRERRNVRTR